MKVFMRRLCTVIIAATIALVGSVFGTSGKALAAASDHKVTITAGKSSCSTKSGKLYVKVSKKAKKGALLCGAKKAYTRYSAPMHLRVQIVKNSKEGKTARVDVLLHASPATSKKWSKTTVRITPISVGYAYFGHGYVYSNSQYKWFPNIATKNTNFSARFKVETINNKTGKVTSIVYQNITAPAYYSRG